MSAASIAAKVTRDRALKQWVYPEPALAAAMREGAAPAAAREEPSEEAPEGGGGSYSEVEEGEGEGAGGGEGEAPGAPARGRARGAGEAEARSMPPLPRLPSLHPCTAGSGYPGDPLTKAWLRRTLDPVFGWPSVLRFSWATAKDLLDKGEAAVRVEWEEEEAAVGGPGGAPPGPDSRQTSLSSMFGGAGAGAGAGAGRAGAGGPPGAGAGGLGVARMGQRHAWFRRHRLEMVTDL